MKKVARDEIVDYVTYEEQREVIRSKILKTKKVRRIHLGENLTFLFENKDTIRYQIQEMVRTEKIVKEADIQHEIDTYNELLGEKGELGCTLMIEIDDPEERDVKLRDWIDLPNHLYMRMEDGSKASAVYDKRQIGDDRLSAVQYLKFNTGGKNISAIGCDLPQYSVLTEFNSDQSNALKADLNEE